MPATVFAVWTTITTQLAFESLRHRVHVRLRLLERNAGRETRKYVEKVWTTALRHLFLRVTQRQPNIGRFSPRKTRVGKLKARRHYTHHREAFVIERDVLINDVAITRKVSLEETITQHNELLLVSGKHSSRRSLRLKHRKEIRRNIRATNAFRFRTGRQVETLICIRRYRVEDLGLLGVIIVLGSFGAQPFD